MNWRLMEFQIDGLLLMRLSVLTYYLMFIPLYHVFWNQEHLTLNPSSANECLTLDGVIDFSDLYFLICKPGVIMQMELWL